MINIYKTGLNIQKNYKLSESQTDLIKRMLSFKYTDGKRNIQIRKYNEPLKINKQLDNFYYITYLNSNNKFVTPFEYISHKKDYDIKNKNKVNKRTMASLIKKGLLIEHLDLDNKNFYTLNIDKNLLITYN